MELEGGGLFAVRIYVRGATEVREERVQLAGTCAGAQRRMNC